jgi:hypothetical protein
MMAGQVPVIIGEAPPATAAQKKGYQVFHDLPEPRVDEQGPPRLKVSTPSSSSSRRQAVVVMPSPTKSSKGLYKTEEFGKL